MTTREGIAYVAPMEHPEPPTPALLRCPYCDTVFTARGPLRCPSCARVLRLPPALRPPRARRPDASRHAARRDLSPTALLAAWFGNPRPRAIFSVFMLAFLAAFLLTRSRSEPFTWVATDPVLRARENLTSLRVALELFQRDCGRYPRPAEGLPALLHDIGLTGWRGPYIISLTRDPWRHAFRFEETASGVTVSSCGPDGIPSTADDITVTNLDAALWESFRDAGLEPHDHPTVQVLASQPDHSSMTR